LYLLTVAVVSQYFKKKIDAVPSPELYELLEEKSSLVLRNSKTPMLLLDSYGTILWLNESMHDICVDKENYIGQNISSVIKAPINKDTFHGKPIEVFGRIYEIEGFTISESGNGLYLVSLNDVTDFKDVEKRYADERIAVAYVSIDNVEDIVQYVHEKFKDAVSEVDDKIKSFARSLNGVREHHLLPYHRLGMDKYDGLGRKYSLSEIEPPSREKMEYLLSVAETSGLKCKIGG
jgi:c-di-AMP phosphodiesterase-like protein